MERNLFLLDCRWAWQIGDERNFIKTFADARLAPQICLWYFVIMNITTPQFRLSHYSHPASRFPETIGQSRMDWWTNYPQTIPKLMELLSLEAQEGQRSELLPLADGQSEPALAQLALELGRTARLAAWRELEWMECWNVNTQPWWTWQIFTERRGRWVIGQD